MIRLGKSSSQVTSDASVKIAPFSSEDAFTLYEKMVNRDAVADFYDIQETNLLDRLIDAGLCPASLPAISLVPIAFVAWASGFLTPQESRVAILSIYNSGARENCLAMACVQS